MRALLALPCLLTLAFAGPAQAEDKPAKPKEGVTLYYSFKALDGKVATYRIENTLRQSKRVKWRGVDAKRKAGTGGGSAESTQRQTYEVGFKRAPRGLGRVTIKPTRIVSKLSENKKLTYSYDSRSKRSPPPMLRALTRTLGRTAILDVTRFGKVKRVRGVGPKLRKAYEKNFHVLPTHRLVVGKGWEQKKKQPIPPFGTLHYFTSFRLTKLVPAVEGKEAKRHVSAKIFVTYEGVGPSQHSRLKITSQKGKGSLVFAKSGLLLEERLFSEVVYTIKSPTGTEVHTILSRTSRHLLSLKDAPKKE